MSKQPNLFEIRTTDLGDANAGVDRLGIDQLFSTANLGTGATCIICSNPPIYKLVPKRDSLHTAEIEDRGYICSYCIEQGYIKPTDYALKELK